MDMKICLYHWHLYFQIHETFNSKIQFSKYSLHDVFKNIKYLTKNVKCYEQKYGAFKILRMKLCAQN